MNVRELIRMLKRENPEALVVHNDWEGDPIEITQIERRKVDSFQSVFAAYANIKSKQVDAVRLK